MKKFMGLSALLLGGAMFLTGCSCGEKGVYKFDSLEYTVGGETKTLTCSEEEVADQENAFVCLAFGGATYELKDDGVLAITHTMGDESETEDAQYKVEDGKFFVRDDSEDEWTELGAIDNGTLTFEINQMGMNVKAYYKK